MVKSSLSDSFQGTQSCRAKNSVTELECLAIVKAIAHFAVHL